MTYVSVCASQDYRWPAGSDSGDDGLFRSTYGRHSRSGEEAKRAHAGSYSPPIELTSSSNHPICSATCTRSTAQKKCGQKMAAALAEIGREMMSQGVCFSCNRAERFEGEPRENRDGSVCSSSGLATTRWPPAPLIWSAMTIVPPSQLSSPAAALVRWKTARMNLPPYTR